MTDFGVYFNVFCFQKERMGVLMGSNNQSRSACYGPETAFMHAANRPPFSVHISSGLEQRQSDKNLNGPVIPDYTYFWQNWSGPVRMGVPNES